MDVIIRKKVIEGIPLLELSDAGGQRRPLVLMYHGYAGCKDFMLNQAYFLSSQGFTVAVPDAWGHGERNPGGLCDFFDAVLNTAGEVETLLEYYQDQPIADADRAGITGYSMGGCIVLETISRPWGCVKAAVPFIATPDWEALMNAPGTAQLFLANGLITDPAEMQAFASRARDVQPLKRLAEMAGLPLLMLNGEDDPLMPVESVRRFCEELKPLYGYAQDVRLSVYPGVAHMDTAQMNIEMAMWFLKYL